MDDVLGVCHVNHDIIRGSTHECDLTRTFGPELVSQKYNVRLYDGKYFQLPNPYQKCRTHIDWAHRAALFNITKFSSAHKMRKFQNGRICNCICIWDSPQILRGASSSRRIGWLRKSSLDLRHRPRISVSVSWTFFPGRDPLTVTRI